MSDSKVDLQQVKLGNNVGLHALFYHLDELVKWKNREYFPPLFVDISPTSQCNQNCFFCFTEWLRKSPKTIPEELLVNIFVDMAKAGVKVCEVQGTGEPFLHPVLPDAIVAGNEAGMKICVVSNGTVLTRDILRKILPHVTFFRISNIEKTPELYAKTHGCSEKQFQKAIKTLENAVDIRNRENLGTVITATVIVFDYNAPHVVDTTGMLRDIGVDIVHIKSPGIMHHNRDHMWATDSYIRYREKLMEAQSLSRGDFKVNVRVDYFDLHNKTIEKSYRKCCGIEFATHMSPEAKLYPCYSYWEDERYCLGDLKTKSFAELWSGEERKKAMQKFYDEVDNRTCSFFCKQHSSNEVLWALANPPLHADTF